MYNPRAVPLPGISSKDQYLAGFLDYRLGGRVKALLRAFAQIMSSCGEASEDLKQPFPLRLANLVLDMPLVLGGEPLELRECRPALRREMQCVRTPARFRLDPFDLRALFEGC